MAKRPRRDLCPVAGGLEGILRGCICLLGDSYVRTSGGRCSAAELSAGCLRYVYRLLYCLYLDSRKGPGLPPFRRLRKMVRRPLRGAEGQNAYSLSDAVQGMFRTLYEGGAEDGGLPALKARLFNPAEGDLTNKLRVPDPVLRQVLGLLLYEGGRKRNVRDPYAGLELGGLGALYGDLLGCTAFFPQEVLYEVKPEKEVYDPRGHAFFVPEGKLQDYKPGELAMDADGRPVRHGPGGFIYRMAGSNRKNSASYYTPEALTRATVDCALKELLPGMSADAILRLKVCEPAVGSAAFLNAAIDRLAETYLERKQAETGRRIPTGGYRHELQRCKSYIAARNVVGVDLDGTALELAEVSLLLNCIHTGAAPALGGHLFHGNSLVGARRLCRPAAALAGGLQDAVPLPYDHRAHRRPAGSVYHWLAPDEGMAAADTLKACRWLDPEGVKLMRAWHRRFVRPWTEPEIRTAVELSDAADRLWLQVEAEQGRLEAENAAAMAVWPDAPAAGKPWQEGDTPTPGAMHRLQLAMDYWCALWFWPPEEAGALPSPGEFLAEMADILTGTGGGLPEDRNPRLRIVRRVAGRFRFFHWELSCAWIFRERGGFDIILGNPPWLRLEFEESALLGEYDPSLIIRKTNADQVAVRRAELLQTHPDLRTRYAQGLYASETTSGFLSARSLYPLLEGQAANPYKNFITLAWGLAAPVHVVGFLHPEGVFDSPRGGVLRPTLYRRLRRHFQFVNARKLFAGVAGVMKFSLNVYGVERKSPAFDAAWNLVEPAGIDASYGDSGGVVRITRKELQLFARLFDGKVSGWQRTCLPRLQNGRMLGILQKIADYPVSIASLGKRICSSLCWNETTSRKDGTLVRRTHFPEEAEGMVLSGPHFYVANPLQKTPRAVCKEKSDYDVLPLQLLPDDYRPRVNYAISCRREEYRRRIRSLPWDPARKFNDCYKISFRQMAQPGNEHTLIAALTCAGAAHINGARSITTRSMSDLVAVAGVLQSLPADFYIKMTGAENIHYQWLNLPLLPASPAIAARVLALNCLTRDYAALWREVWQEDMQRQRWYGDDPRLPEGFWGSLTPEWRRGCALRSDFARRWALCELDVLVARGIGLSLEELCGMYRGHFPVLCTNEAGTWYDRHGRIACTCSLVLKGVGLPVREFGQVKDAPAGGTVSKTWVDDTQPGGPVERPVVYEAPFDIRDRERDYAAIWAALDAAQGEK